MIASEELDGYADEGAGAEARSWTAVMLRGVGSQRGKQCCCGGGL